MNRNYRENGQAPGPELSLGEKLTDDVLRALETMDAKKFGVSASVSQVKGAFPHITDRDLDRTTGRSKRTGNNTGTIPTSKILGIAVNAWNRSDVGKPPYEKALKAAIRDGNTKFEEKKKKAKVENSKGNNNQNGANRKPESRHTGKPKETVVWHGKTRMVV